MKVLIAEPISDEGIDILRSSALRICSIGGTQNNGANMAKPRRQALPDMVQGRRGLPSCCIIAYQIDTLPSSGLFECFLTFSD